MSGLFRQEALDTISTPEQLDRHVKILPAPLWGLWLAAVLALAAFVLWAFLYPIADTIPVKGVVFTNSSLVTHNAQRPGILADVLVRAGEDVSTGDILAVVRDDALLEQIRQARADLADARGDGERAALEEKLTALLEEHTAACIIRSSTTGTVQSVRGAGTAVAPGDQIAGVMSHAGYEEVVAYVPLQTRAGLELGMAAQVSPTYAPREKYGYMTGVVVAISDIPVTQEGIVARMGTAAYLDGILPQGPCVEVRIRMDLDENSRNGFRWSNAKGERLPVELGAQCDIQVVADEYRPVELLWS